MTEKLELYRCKHCGMIIQVMQKGAGTLVCCGEPMEKLEHNTEETNLYEKHIPVFEHDENCTVVKVGSVPHPMIQEHYIQFIQVISEDKNCIQTKFLHPNEDPQIKIKDGLKPKCAIEYCNLHGLFKGEHNK